MKSKTENIEEQIKDIVDETDLESVKINMCMSVSGSVYLFGDYDTEKYHSEHG